VQSLLAKQLSVGAYPSVLPCRSSSPELAEPPEQSSEMFPFPLQYCSYFKGFSVALPLIADRAARVGGLINFVQLCSNSVRPYLRSIGLHASVHGRQKRRFPLSPPLSPFRFPLLLLRTGPA
jgi:hypothetical protein